MLQTQATRTQSASAGRRIVVAQDTTEINFSGHEARRRGLGPAGDGVSAGFFIHPLIAIDSETEAVLGLLDAHIWTREGKIDAGDNRPFEEKESIRWLWGAQRANELLTDAASTVVVGDRENDVYGCIARCPAGVDLIIRAAQDRALAEGPSLFAVPATWPELKRTRVKVSSRRVGDPGRTATVALRAGPVAIRKPDNGFAKTDPKTVTMTLVEAKEIDPPAGEKPLHWRLLTTIAVDDAAAAAEIVRLYRLRWRVEEVFRALKSDGMRLEETQVQEAGRLFKLAVVGMAAACRTIQLVDARDGSPRPASDVIDPALLPAAEAIETPQEEQFAPTLAPTESSVYEEFSFLTEISFHTPLPRKPGSPDSIGIKVTYQIGPLDLDNSEDPLFFEIGKPTRTLVFEIHQSPKTFIRPPSVGLQSAVEFLFLDRPKQVAPSRVSATVTAQGWRLEMPYPPMGARVVLGLDARLDATA